jgi:carboxymethylenebutenolidase
MTRRVIALVLMVFVVGLVVRRRVLASELAGVRAAWTNSQGTTRSTGTRSADTDPLPASATTAADRLAKSPRHREYVSFPTPGVPGDSIRAWVFYPQVSGKAPVVVVIHEIFGMTTWVKAVGDQIAADGFIAIVPDLIHRPMPPGSPDTMAQDAAVTAIRTLDPAAVQRDILAAATYATSLPSALPLYATVGFCWGGSQSFLHDVYTPSAATPRFKAAVVYYGGTPDSTKLSMARGPVLGLYGGEDARISSTIPATDSAMQRLHKTYTGKVYPGAGHGFLRAQEGQNGANATATSDAWPRTIAWFRQYLVS